MCTCDAQIKEGIQVFEKERSGIVFTNIKMPGMEGFEVVSRESCQKSKFSPARVIGKRGQTSVRSSHD